MWIFVFALKAADRCFLSFSFKKLVRTGMLEDSRNILYPACLGKTEIARPKDERKWWVRSSWKKFSKKWHSAQAILYTGAGFSTNGFYLSPVHGGGVEAGRTEWLKSSCTGTFTHPHEVGSGQRLCDSGYDPLGAVGFNHGWKWPYFSKRK